MPGGVHSHHSSRPSTHAFIRCAIRAGFCVENMSDLVEDADDVLFERAMRDKRHVLYHLFF